MNCPNCGGLLDLEKRRCEFCDTTFTEQELGLSVDTEETVPSPESESQPEPMTMTERRKQELERERRNRKPVSEADAADIAREVAIGASVMGAFGLFARVRRFFRDLKRTACIVLLIALEIGFAFLMISGVVPDLFENDIIGFAASNVVILANGLLAGLICRIGRVRVGTAVVAVVNFLAVAWVYVYPLIVTGFEGITPQYVAILAVIEMAVLALSVLFAHLIYKR